MSDLIRLYPGDRGVELLLAVAMVVAVTSSVAWLLSRRLAGNAALRHHVLFTALIGCLASPVAAWFYAATGLTLVSIPILGSDGARIAPGTSRMEVNLEETPSRPAIRPPHVAADPPPPHSSTTTDSNSNVEATRTAVPGPDASPPPELGPRRSDVPTVIDPSFRGIAMGVMFLWVTGTVLMLGRLARNCLGAVRLRHASTPLQDERLQTLFQKVKRQSGARQEPVLLGVDRAIAPLAIAFGRPAVILPERLLGVVSDNELTDILVHEVAHIERGDPWVVLLQELVAALYWPIVSVHGLNRELRQACEEVCDNVVLAGRDAIGYGETLLHVARLLVEARPMGASVGIIGGPGQLERRIAGLLDPRRNTMTRAGRKAAWVVTLVFIAGIAVASAMRFAVVAGTADGPQTDAPTALVTTELGGIDFPAVAQDAPPAVVIDPDRKVVLRGKVFGPGNRPLAGARLYLDVDEWTDPTELGTSDANGDYRFVVPESTLRRTLSPNFVHADCNAALIATAPGLGPDWAELKAAQGGRMGEMKPEYSRDLHLVGDLPIAGRVVDIAGKPIANAQVAVQSVYSLGDRRWYKMHAAIKAGNPGLMSREESDPNNWFTPLYPTAWRMIPPATTDEEGRFRIAGVGLDRAIRLAVSGPGIRSDTVSVLTRDDVADFTESIRKQYPRTRRPRGFFYPPRKDVPEGDQGVRLFGPSPTIEVDPARTVTGVVRDASTGEPIANYRMGIASGSGYAAAQTDSHGRYHILRDEDDSSILMFSDHYHTDRYLITVRRLNGTKGFGDIVADFDIPRGVVIHGRVLEAGTDRPIVSAPRQGCHDTVPGPLLAGYVSYFPLSSNTTLRGSPTGLYFEGIPTGGQNYYRSVPIDGEGRFRLAVPPGPGVLMVHASPGLPMFAEAQVWKESAGYHRLFPYVKLKTRVKNDGAPEGDPQSLPGFNGPIPLSTYEAYQVINPSATTTTLDLKIFVPRAPSRTLHFVDPDGRAIRGVTVRGLLAPPNEMTFVLGGAEAEVLALEPGVPRQVTVKSNDGNYSASASVSTDDPQPRTIRLARAPLESGLRLVAPTPP
jgi:beta-lactamase regulating signal transducer with metallopeptidase domain